MLPGISQLFAIKYVVIIIQIKLYYDNKGNNMNGISLFSNKKFVISR